MTLALFAAAAPEGVVLKPVANMYGPAGGKTPKWCRRRFTEATCARRRPAAGWRRVRTPDD